MISENQGASDRPNFRYDLWSALEFGSIGLQYLETFLSMISHIRHVQADATIQS